MDDGTPTLEVGFAIDTGASFGELQRLEQAMDSAEAKVISDAKSIERATGNMLNLGGATARMFAFTAAATREAASVARATNQAEKSAEGMIRQLQRQAETYGMTASQARAFRAEQKAAAAESLGLTEVAARLRAASAEMTRLEAASGGVVNRGFGPIGTGGKLAGYHVQNLAFQFQDLGIQMAMAVQSGHPVKMMLMAFMQQGAQIKGIMSQAGIGFGEALRQLGLMTGVLREVSTAQTAVAAANGTVATSNGAVAATARAAAAAEQQLGFAFGEAAGGANLATAANAGVAGSSGAAAAGSRLMTTALSPLGLALAAVAAVAGIAAIGIRGLQNAANDRSDMKAYAASLGLTAKEIRHLDDVTVTWGDTAKAVFQVAGRAIWSEIGPAVTYVWDVMKDWTAWVFSGVKAAANFSIGAWVGGYHAIAATWRLFPAMLGDLFVQAVNKAIDGINFLIQKSIAGINWMVDQANKILPEGWQLEHVADRAIAHVENQWAGAAANVGSVWRTEMGKAMGTDYVGNAVGAVTRAVSTQAIQNAQDRIRAQAEKKDYLDPEKGKKPKTDKHAEQLARENEAIEAQIRNLYALADAYKVSGAEALIAEARVKAESDAIKKRGDIELFVNRQIRLTIAQRVSDAAKATAAVRDQADVQEAANRLVADGTVTAERAAQLVKDQIEDLPLLAALQVAQQRGLADEAARATAALEDQRVERERLRKAEEAAEFSRDMRTGANRLAELREELRLVGATDAVRTHALAALTAAQEAEAKFQDPARRAAYVAQQVQIADEAERLAAAQREYNDALMFAADKWDLIASNIQAAGQGMADAFGSTGQALGDLASVYAAFHASRERMDIEHARRLRELEGNEAAKQRENQLFALRASTAQIGLYGDMAAAAKDFFKEGSDGYKALATAEKVFRAIQFALSVRAMVQDAAETASAIAKSGARTAAHAVEAIVKAISSLPFPLNLAAGAATAAAIAALGVTVAGAFGGGGRKPEASNTGTGTVLGDTKAQSESLKRSIDALKEVDTTTSVFAREMAASLRSIDSQIGGFTAQILKAGPINASAGVLTGFKTDATGKVLSHLVDPFGLLSKIPVIGGIFSGIKNLIGSLFGSKTSVIGSGLYGAGQSLGSILMDGFDAAYYSDIQKKKKFFGLTTGTSYSTRFSDADPALENHFTLILRSFSDAIKAAAGPLGESTAEIEARLNGFVVNIGKIDLQGLTGQQIQEKLTAIFGAAADSMANVAFPGIAEFQRVGEGAFETLVRVASTIEAVTNALEILGAGAADMGMAAKMGLADQFDSISALNDAVTTYFQAFYTKEEQAAAKTAQLSRVFDSLGLAMPSTLAAFRQLIEAQDLTTAAGQATYAALLQLAPAFADLQSSLAGAKSAADILSERQDLERKLLELQGNTEAIRQLDLAKLDQSNRALQLQIWAIEDGQAAAKAAEELRQAWKSVGDTIMDEVRRIRGLADTTGAGTFASLMGQFNAMTAAARGGDMDAAKALPQLSQALLTAAANAATSRQELDRIRAQTAASLEVTYGLITSLGSAPPASNAALLSAGASAQPNTSAANDNLVSALTSRIDDLTAKLEQMRAENTAGHAATASNTGSIKRTLDNVTQESGGNAVKIVA